MPKRTSILSIFPWNGGLNTSLDEGMIQPGELTAAKNLAFDYQTAKQRREGINYDWDNSDFVTAVRSSAGTTRTLTGYFSNNSLIVGDLITITESSVPQYNVNLGAVTAVTNLSATVSSVDTATDTITAASHGLPSNAAVFYINDSNPIGGLTNRKFYYILNSTTNTFQLSLTPGGAAIDLTTAGTGSSVFTHNTVSYTAVGSLTEADTEELSAILFNKVVGGAEFWFGSSDSKGQWLVTVLDNGIVYRTSAGSRNRVLDGGLKWNIPIGGLTEANLEVFNNKVFIAVSGPTNQGKYWDGVPANSLRDVPANLALVSVNRMSAGTTRTLTLSAPVTIPNGSPLLVTSSNLNYAGTYLLASGSGTNIITYVATTAFTEAQIPDVDISIGTNAPYPLFYRQHQNRLFSNNKFLLDRLEYSETDTGFIWGGIGTSGALDIGVGDGDPQGLTGIAPTFKADLYVGKRTKLYRLTGDDADLYSINKQSNGIGFLNHGCLAAVDQDDIIFVSDRGVHTLASTVNYGDFEAYFISKTIQRSFALDWTAARRRYIKTSYIPNTNCVIFAVSYKGSSVNNSLWIYNTELKYWFYWPDVEAESLITSLDLDTKRVYMGTFRGRLAQTYTGENLDTTYAGERKAIQSSASTGLIFVDSRPDTVKGFKKVGLVFSPVGSYEITVRCKIDNYPEQAISFSNTGTGALLGEFILGEDLLSGSYTIAPYTLPIDGYGRGIKITVEQSDFNSPIAVQGILIEYEGAGDMQETDTGDTT